MKRNGLFFFLISLFSLSNAGVSAQISHGGKPFFLQDLPSQSPKGGVVSSVVEYPAAAKSPSGDSGVSPQPSKEGTGNFEMPTFDLDSIMREDQMEERNSLRSYRFAHKFFTKIEKRKDAALTILPDGTKVWQIGIRSNGAYSINVLLTDFELPPGGKLFAYSSNYSHVIGSFDYRNNSPEKILPLRPVAGESIIIEYSEPVDVPFEGNFTVSEVNHDYRDFFRREPGSDGGSIFSCMPDALCSEMDKNPIRSTVLLMINGTTACTGVLVNNTEDDGTPYILTAVHCLNDSLEYGIYKNREHYITTSGTIVSFFNYNRPVCGTQLKGTEEMTMAETYPRVILERRDVALLELREKPPVYYDAYYAGWNMDESGRTGIHTNLHHPSAAVKKYGKTETDLSVVNFSPEIFERESHWKVPAWTIGSTYGGSSGSPLFDSNGLVVGTLTGGSSNCNGSAPNGASDYFTILYKSWETTEPEVDQLKTYLDPGNKDLKQQPGFDPNHENPLIRLSNMDFSAGDALVVSNLEAPNSGFVYGSSNLETVEFAEEFTVENAVEIFGVYLFVPPLSANDVSGVDISVYSGEISPERLLQTQTFSPKYLNYDSSGFNPEDKNMKNTGTETFVLFDEPIKIAKGKFFISYTINGGVRFCVYNAKFADAGKRNTAWVKESSQGWIRANVYLPAQAVKTSLAIQALVRSTKMDSIPEFPEKTEDPLFFDSKNAVLSLREFPSEPVSVNIYSLTGVLMEKVQFDKDKKSVSLAKKSKGSIGIARLILSNKTCSKKIIY
ncbi:MAG: trypsin-like peptidase domain-containing protein [Dysgonamonadaceae bacterium]|jgi:hypothetical protein|nr:trypsin-like peptidase domain-containing protein [Dysgonamonadaceae bacterium]